MGTSMNQHSPKTPNWQAVGVAYAHPDINAQRAVQEIWRASSTDASGGMAASLSTTAIANCVDIVKNSTSSVDAVRQIRNLITSTGQANLAADIAQRAAILAYTNKKNRVNNFVQSLFTEASNYLVSRDIPGYVGSGDKLRTIKDVVALKTSIVQGVASTVQGISIPEKNLTKPANWKKFVDKTVKRLEGRD